MLRWISQIYFCLLAKMLRSQDILNFKVRFPLAKFSLRIALIDLVSRTLRDRVAFACSDIFQQI